jgi:DNA mismatch repair protein MutS2
MSPQLLHSSSRVLEFESLREMLRAYAPSPLGQARISNLTPSTGLEWIQAQQALASEIREFRRVGGRFDFAGLVDITALVERARIAGVALETADIRDVILVVDRAAEWREIARHPPAAMRSEWRQVHALSDRIADLVEFLRGFRNKIQPDGTLEDKASPELSRIRRDMEKQRRSIQESLRVYLRRLAEGGRVQDELITIRG